MNKANVKNELIKRKFSRWLKHADQCCDATVDNVEKAICLYEEFTKWADFATFNADKAVAFKEWLAKRTFRGRPLALTTYHTYVRYLRKFFNWLAWQPGYRSRVTPDSVDYLRVTEKEERMARQTSPRNYPVLEYVQTLASSIVVRNEIDQRDRALIAFTLLTGMRDKAIVTLPLGCFDENALIVDQNPRLGVQTKFSKSIQTTIFPFDEALLKHTLDWTHHLKAKGFGTADPLFPRAKMEKGSGGLSFEISNEVEPAYWQSAGRMREIFKKRANEANRQYFPPHTFRHLAIVLALKFCKNGEQYKAISQNFGHDDLATTLSAYGQYAPNELHQIISGINFRDPLPDNKLEELKKLVLAFK